MIAAKKKPFAKMTPRQKRVAIARDVLYLLSLGVKPMTGTYLNICNFDEEDEEKDAKKCIPHIANQCEVCGIGAMFLSYVHKTDKMTLGVLADRIRNEMVEDMKDIFTERELEIIEACFEGWTLDGSDNDYFLNNELIGSAYRMGRNSHDTLMAICKNIIKHGSFKPEKDVKEVYE